MHLCRVVHRFAPGQAGLAPRCEILHDVMLKMT
jgi:hypothetical protein